MIESQDMVASHPGQSQSSDHLASAAVTYQRSSSIDVEQIVVRTQTPNGY